MTGKHRRYVLKKPFFFFLKEGEILWVMGLWQEKKKKQPDNKDIDSKSWNRILYMKWI